MESNNLPPFYVGEEVEYVTGFEMPKGTKVRVTDIWRDVCGCWMLTHSVKKSRCLSEGLFNRCCDCNKIVPDRLPIGIELGWVASSFRRLQRPKPMTFIKLAEIQETEKEEVLTLN